VNIFFVGNSRAWSFGVEHDAGEWVYWDRVDDNGYLINADGKWIDDEGNLSSVGFLAIEHDEGELRYILDSLEIGADEDDIHHFEDEDGETIYFRALEIALFEVPHSAISPGIQKKRMKRNRRKKSFPCLGGEPVSRLLHSLTT
jgi:hypothetical protein